MTHAFECASKLSSGTRHRHVVHLPDSGRAPVDRGGGGATEPVELVLSVGLGAGGNSDTARKQHQPNDTTHSLSCQHTHPTRGAATRRATHLVTSLSARITAAHCRWSRTTRARAARGTRSQCAARTRATHWTRSFGSYRGKTDTPECVSDRSFFLHCCCHGWLHPPAAIRFSDARCVLSSEREVVRCRRCAHCSPLGVPSDLPRWNERSPHSRHSIS